MIRKGVLVFDHPQQEWRAWIGQQSYWVGQGDTFELRIQNRYFNAYVENDMDWFVTLNSEVSFVLRTSEVYKIKINIHDYLSVETPF